MTREGLEPARILIVKLADLGDVLLATPALQRLRLALPDARIDILTTTAGEKALAGSALVDEVIRFDKQSYDKPMQALRSPLAPFRLARVLRQRRYSAIALFHHLTTRFGTLKHAGLSWASGAPIRAGLARPGSPRGRFLSHRAVDLGFDRMHAVAAAQAVVEVVLDALGADVVSSRPDDSGHLQFEIGHAAHATAAALLQPLESQSGPLVILHPGSGRFSEARRWPPHRFAALIDLLSESGARCAIVGRDTDDGARVRQACRSQPLDLSDRTALPALAAVLRQADLFIGNDSGIMHLATAVDTPVLALFGPTSVSAWGPWWPGQDREGSPRPSPHRVLRLGLPCQPCFYRGFELGAPGGCATRDCMAWLEPERVADSALGMLDQA